jgi:hypothetical protein
MQCLKDFHIINAIIKDYKCGKISIHKLINQIVYEPNVMRITDTMIPFEFNEYTLLVSYYDVHLYIKNFKNVMIEFDESKEPYYKNIKNYFNNNVLSHFRNIEYKRKREEREIEEIKIRKEIEKVRQNKRAIKNKLRRININASIKHKQYFKEKIYPELVAKVYHPSRYDYWINYDEVD